MDLRDFFAGQALSGMLAHEGTELDASSVETLVPYMWDVYKVADAMLAAKNAQISEQEESPPDSPASPVQQPNGASPTELEIAAKCVIRAYDLGYGKDSFEPNIKRLRAALQLHH